MGIKVRYQADLVKWITNETYVFNALFLKAFQVKHRDGRTKPFPGEKSWRGVCFNSSLKKSVFAFVLPCGRFPYLAGGKTVD
jgi:hypothetical protein